MDNLALNLSENATDLAATFLPPIERPSNLIMKLVFYFTRRKFGKVLTPFTVFAARMPLAFGSLYGKIDSLDKKLTLGAELTTLLRVQVARINICAFCMDISRWLAISQSMNIAKFDALAEYQSSSLFTDAERAALDYAGELTRDKKITRSTFARLSCYYSERAICEIVWIVASEHVYNLTNIGLNIHSDDVCGAASSEAIANGLRNRLADDRNRRRRARAQDRT